MRLNYFDNFRGFTIILIVAGHCYSTWHIDSISELVLANLITGGTALFVFISGFFFHRIFYSNFKYIDFLKKKFTKVFLPYLILSSIAYILFVVFLDQIYPEFRVIDEINYLALFFKYLWTGRILTAYWYIMFIMIIFLLSPLFIYYIKWSPLVQLTTLMIMLLCSMIIHRPLYNLSPVHSVIYFLPIYFLGIIYSIYENKIYKIIESKVIILGLITIVISLLQIIITQKHGNYHKAVMFTFEGFDILIIQKIFMIFFLVTIFRKYDHIHIPFIKFLASISFGIYFIHPWIISAFDFIAFESKITFVPGFFAFLIKTVLIGGISIVCAIITKKILGKKSRMLIGY